MFSPGSFLKILLSCGPIPPWICDSEFFCVWTCCVSIASVAASVPLCLLLTREALAFVRHACFLVQIFRVSGGITSLFIISPSLKSTCAGGNPSSLLLFTSVKVKLIFLNFYKEGELNRAFLISQRTYLFVFWFFFFLLWQCWKKYGSLFSEIWDHWLLLKKSLPTPEPSFSPSAILFIYRFIAEPRGKLAMSYHWVTPEAPFI